MPGVGYGSDITVGPDGALWFTGASVGRITTSGAVQHFGAGELDASNGIAVGSDGALWFTNEGATPSIGRITTDGVITSFPDPSVGYSESITGSVTAPRSDTSRQPDVSPRSIPAASAYTHSPTAPTAQSGSPAATRWAGTCRADGSDVRAYICPCEKSMAWTATEPW